VNQFLKFKKNYNLKNYTLSTVLILCFFYGFYQLFSDRGLFTLYKVNKELEQQKQANELLKKRQEYLESRVKKLEESSTDFDYDYLEEIIRDKLGVIKKSEKVIYIENEEENK
tara:strand:- start:193 stop:531 length:339 start_codon:yes stop_codon:yes gene_type:complete